MNLADKAIQEAAAKPLSRIHAPSIQRFNYQLEKARKAVEDLKKCPDLMQDAVYAEMVEVAEFAVANLEQDDSGMTAYRRLFQPEGGFTQAEIVADFQPELDKLVAALEHESGEKWHVYPDDGSIINKLEKGDLQAMSDWVSKLPYVQYDADKINVRVLVSDSENGKDHNKLARVCILQDATFLYDKATVMMHVHNKEVDTWKNHMGIQYSFGAKEMARVLVDKCSGVDYR